MKISKKKLIGWGLAAFVGISVIADGTYVSEEGRWYAVQNNLLGKVTTVDTPGFKFKMPFFNRIADYKDYLTIDFGDDSTSGSYDGPCVNVKFADTYTSCIPVTVRYKTTSNLQIHSDFRSNGNLISTLLVKNARAAMIATAEQFTAEEYYQGGHSSFSAAYEDQLAGGLYKTERKLVEVIDTDIELAEVEGSGEGTEKKARMVWKTVPLRDDNGSTLRRDNALDAYGITVSQVTIGKALPAENLAEMLKEKQRLVADRITTVQKQQNAIAEAKTKKLEFDIQIQAARQKALMEKDKQTINAQRVAEVEKINAQREKDVAVIERTKALEIAEANEGIEKANAIAAQHMADAIRFQGLAEAEVTDAKMKALENNKEVVQAQYDRDIKLKLAESLKEFTIEMPEVLIVSGEGNGQAVNSFDQVMNSLGVSSLQGLVDAQKKRNKK